MKFPQSRRFSPQKYDPPINSPSFGEKQRCDFSGMKSDTQQQGRRWNGYGVGISEEGMILENSIKGVRHTGPLINISRVQKSRSGSFLRPPLSS